MQITRYMSDDHRHCDDLFAAAEQAVDADDPQMAERFERFAAAIEHHFDAEENILFPRFEALQGGAGGPSMVMRSEHLQMRSLIEEMRQALQATDAERYLDLSETLLVMMQQHNLKEEQILYPMTDQMLGEQSATLLEQIDAR